MLTMIFFDCLSTGDIPTSKEVVRVKPYTLVTADELDAYRKEMEEQAAEQMAVTLEEAGCLLKAFSWAPEKMMNEWYADRERTREKTRVFAPFDQKSAPKQVQ